MVAARCGRDGGRDLRRRAPEYAARLDRNAGSARRISGQSLRRGSNMAASTTSAAQADARTVVITRVFDAPRELVWKAWTDPKHLAQWWGPKAFTNPTVEVDARPGGKIWIVMRGPKDTAFDNDFPMSGTVHEVVPPERLVFTAIAEDQDGNPLLKAHTIVT